MFRPTVPISFYFRRSVRVADSDVQDLQNGTFVALSFPSEKGLPVAQKATNAHNGKPIYPLFVYGQFGGSTRNPIFKPIDPARKTATVIVNTYGLEGFIDLSDAANPSTLNPGDLLKLDANGKVVELDPADDKSLAFAMVLGVYTNSILIRFIK